MTPRGIRNCNPGNIRITKDKWQGLRDSQDDPEFFQYVSMEYGYRALIRTLQNYHRRHDCRTIGQYITRWAPGCENNTAAYIRDVCYKLNVPAWYQPDINDCDTMCAFAAAISEHENGVNADMNVIRTAWSLL